MNIITLGYTRSFLLLLQAFACSGFNTFLPLPKECLKKPIYYPYSRQLDDYSCGYNVLYNACCLEHLRVRFNKYAHNKKLFKKTVQHFLISKHAKPQHTSSSNWLYELAPLLSLENFHCLTFDKQHVRLLCKDGVTVEYILGTPKATINAMLAQAWEKKEKKLVQMLRKRLAKLPCCLHFACYCRVQGTDHVILLTLVRDNYKRKSLYIFDNLNTKITSKSAVMMYINWVIKNFDL